MEITGKYDYKVFFTVAGIMGLIGVLGGVADIGISIVMGGADISTLPKDAIGRFAMFHTSAFAGLYSLDLLNVCMSLVTLPFFLGIALAQREHKQASAILAFTVAVIGATVFASNNVALPMLSLSKEYFVATDDARRQAIMAAGEALLSRGAHGSPGAFPGFILSTLSSLLFAFLMLRTKVFSKPVAILGIAGSSIMIFYLIVVTFMPGLERIAMFVVMFSGLSSLAWMVLVSLRLIKIGRNLGKA